MHVGFAILSFHLFRYCWLLSLILYIHFVLNPIGLPLLISSHPTGSTPVQATIISCISWLPPLAAVTASLVISPCSNYSESVKIWVRPCHCSAQNSPITPALRVQPNFLRGRQGPTYWLPPCPDLFTSLTSSSCPLCHIGLLTVL